ncbi:hypothetical protein M426DRAFT_26381 [Hypoxylon sp. CI-4A]|nr:hypothetical protein M426DRAFT_26381 [Hypoxylon sp. CI-4A]
MQRNQSTESLQTIFQLYQDTSILLRKKEEGVKQKPSATNVSLDETKPQDGAAETQNDELIQLTEEIKRLKRRNYELNNVRIMNLPYHREFYSDDAETEYARLIFSVRGFVDNWTYPIIENDDLKNKSLEIAKQNPGLIREFQKHLGDDLTAATRVPDIDPDILVGFVWRFLQQAVFSPIMGGIAPNAVEVISGLGDIMVNYPELKFNHDQVCRWRSQSYIAMLRHPDVREQRNLIAHKISNSLAYMLSFLAVS